MEVLDTLGIHWQQLLINVIGFILLFLVLRKYLWGPFTKLLDDRRDEIQGAYDGIEQKEAEIARIQADYEQHLENIKEEAHQKLQDAIREGQLLARKIEDDARAKADGIVQKGHAEVEAEFTKAKVQLKEFIVDTSVKAAEKVIRETLDDAKHRKLIEDYIKELADVG
jgi:F-type H+-transporting ATPase subunit b